MSFRCTKPSMVYLSAPGTVIHRSWSQKSHPAAMNSCSSVFSVLLVKLRLLLALLSQVRSLMRVPRAMLQCHFTSYLDWVLSAFWFCFGVSIWRKAKKNRKGFCWISCISWVPVIRHLQMRGFRWRSEHWLSSDMAWFVLSPCLYVHTRYCSLKIIVYSSTMSLVLW